MVADIEIINMVEGFLQNSSHILLDMKNLNFACNNMLEETDVNYKQYFKQLLPENIPEIQFICLPARNQPEQICSFHGQNKAVEKSFQNTYDSYQNIFQAAKNISREVLAEEKWQFNESYDGFSESKSVELLLRWILCGPRKIRKQQHREMKLKSQ